eukprot:Em0001g2900a
MQLLKSSCPTNLKLLCSSIQNVAQQYPVLLMDALQVADKSEGAFARLGACHSIYDQCFVTDEKCAELDKAIVCFMDYFRTNFPNENISPKMHLLEDHTVEWDSGFNAPLFIMELSSSMNMECSEEDIYMYTMAGYDFDWKCVGRRLFSDLQKVKDINRESQQLYVIDIDNEGGIEEGMSEDKSLEWTSHNRTCNYQELVKVGADRENNATAGHVEESKREFKSQVHLHILGLLQGQHLKNSTESLYMSLQDIRALQGISLLECLHFMFKRHDPDFIQEYFGEREQTIKLQHTNLDHSDCKVLGYNIANSKQMWNLELHDCCIDKDCMQTLMATEHGRAFDYIKSMDLSNNHQLGDQGATVLGVMLRENRVLTSLGLQDCGLICSALQVNTTLTSLDLSGNKFDDQSKASLWAMLQENKTLTSLVLENYGPYTENLHVHVCEVNTMLATSDDANFNTLETDSTDSFKAPGRPEYKQNGTICLQDESLAICFSRNGATGSVILSPQGNYTVFQSPNPAVFTCSGDGIIAVWTLNGTSSSVNGVTITPYDPTLGAVVPSHLSIIPNANYNNTQVACAVVTYLPTLRFLLSSPTLLIIQGLLGAPYDFSVAMSNTSNTTFLLSWRAPLSLDVTDSPDIFYYTLCANITIYGCRTISSDPDCTFPRTCMSSVDFTHPSLNGTNGGQNKTIMDYGDPIYFTFFAVNGAGSGENNTYLFIPQKQGPNTSLIQTEATEIVVYPTTSSARTGTGTEYSLIGGIIAGALLIAATCTSVVALFRLSAYIRARRNAELDMKADVNTVGTDEHIADSKNVPLHKPEVPPEELWCQESASVTGGSTLVEAESYNLRTCSEVYDDNNSYCYNKAACPIPFNEDVFTKQTQITSAGIMNSSDVPRRGIEERMMVKYWKLINLVQNKYNQLINPVQKQHWPYLKTCFYRFLSNLDQASRWNKCMAADEMKRSNVPHFEILEAPIGDLVFCAKFVAQKQSEASKLLQQLEAVGSIDPQGALLLLRQFKEAFALFDDRVQQCFSECTAVDASASTWQQAQLSLKT